MSSYMDKIKEQADKGDLKSMYILAYRYSVGIGVKLDLKKSFELYSKSADLGYTDSQIQVAFCYLTGRGVEKDINKALDNFLIASKDNNITAKYYYFYYYVLNINTITDDEAKSLLKYLYSAANGGYVDAQYRIGQCYEFGFLKDLNFTTALNWYEKASESGSLDAKFRAAINYLYTFEDKREQGIDYLIELSNDGYNKASLELGLHFLLNESNVQKALFYLNLAVRQGNREALDVITKI